MTTAGVSLTVSDVISGCMLLLSIAVLILSNVRSQAAMRAVQDHNAQELKKHSEAIKRSEVDLVKTTIMAEKNRQEIVEIKSTLFEVRDLVRDLAARKSR